MFARVSRYAGIGWRFLFPDRAARSYIRVLRDSALFDRAFYFGSNPRLRRLFRLAPERHYVLFGEAAGLCPNPGFSPRAYLYHNPDLAATGVQPLLHYIETGRDQGRTVLQAGDVPAVLPLPAIRPDDAPDPRAPVAVVIHLFYPEMWAEFAAALAAQRFAFDLYVTTSVPGDDSAALAARITAEFPAARVWNMPNHGRDIFPFVHLAGSGVLAGYRAICKLHSKKSPHRDDGPDWRAALIGGILGAPDQTAARLAAFLAQDTAGIWVADGHHMTGDDWWGVNRTCAAALLARGGITLPARPLSFPAGSIYWIKPAVLDRLTTLRLTAADFEPEQALVDGTTAHAVERIMGYLAEAGGARVVESRDLDQN